MLVPSPRHACKLLEWAHDGREHVLASCCLVKRVLVREEWTRSPMMSLRDIFPRRAGLLSANVHGIEAQYDHNLV